VLALAMFTRLSVDSLTILLVSGLQFRTAARFADQHMLGLRAGDALHLAICADHGATLRTLVGRYEGTKRLIHFTRPSSQ
jgi:uncharacterized protein